MDLRVYPPRNKEDLVVEHEDDNFIIVNKNYDLHINTNNASIKVTLQTQLEYSYPALVNDSLGHKFHFCHRLDYATSGLLCIGKHKDAAVIMSAAFQARTVTKVYVALIRKKILQEMLEMDQPIGDPSDPEEKRLHVCVGSGVKQRPAKTRLMLLQTGTYEGVAASKVLLLALTGRRHQLRAHTHALGHPIVGDYTYNKDSEPPRMMLHAYHMAIPLQGADTVSVTTEDPFSDELEGWTPLDTVNTLSDVTIQKLVTGPPIIPDMEPCTAPDTDVRTDKKSDVRTDKNSDVKMGKNSDVKKGKNSDVKKGKNSDVEMGKNSDVKKGKNSDVKKGQNSELNSDVRTDKKSEVRIDEFSDLVL